MTAQGLAPSSPEARRALLATLLRRVAEGGVPRTASAAGHPLSAVQRRLWFFDQLEPGTWFYNVPATLAFDGPLDVPALERSLAEIVRCHETLRTTIASGSEEPRQIVAPAASFVLPVLDLTTVPERDRESEARRLASEETLRPFDLARGPLFRATLLRLSPERHVLFATAHHIVCDGLSVRVLLEELAVLYAAFAAGRASPVGELPLQYGAIARSERALLQGETLREQVAYWKANLRGAPPWIELPADRLRPARQTFRGDRQFGRLSAAATERLRSVGRVQGATLFMTLLAAYCTLLSRYSGATDIVVGTPVAGRNSPEMERMIGCFVNMLPLRCDLTGDPSFTELVRRVRDVALGAYRHEALPFDRLVEELNPARDPGRAPLFQTVLNMSSYSDAWTAPVPGLSVTLLDLQHEPSMVDLTLYAMERSDGLQLRAVYKADLFEAATIQQMLRRFERLVDAVNADPDGRISAIDLADSDERSALAGAFSADLDEG
jgi:hypothetical protein